MTETAQKNENTRMYWIQAITPLHVGAGKGVGFIDMPVMREKVTTWPFVPGSAIKGVLRDHFTGPGLVKGELIDAAFGKGGTDVESNAGSLVLTDAHIICMPIRSLYGTFAYVASPLVLERLKRDLAAAGCNDLPAIPKIPDGTLAYPTGSAIPSPEEDPVKKAYLEDLDLTAKEDSKNTGAWADKLAGFIFSDKVWQEIFRKRFVIIPDNCFTYLAEHGTDVAARVRISNETKIVEKGALWYEESLPPETILAGIAWCDRVYTRSPVTKADVLATFCANDLDLQIGGKANVGKGRVRFRFSRS
ncbi:MAG: type III-B CRISPR module RAMP protein Cmr4 [Methanoregula sp.]|nr:type III-B CRISPR module RAMP protein Cmr4 [Methanoregula sp.]